MKKVELLFPELCNIYGESYNIEYLKRCSKDIDVIYTNHKEVPAFVSGGADMVYLGCASERKQEQVIEILKPYRSKIVELINQGVVFLATGNAVEIFGNYIRDGERIIEGLKVFDFYSVRYMKAERHNSQFIGKYDDLTILGHRSQFSFSYGDFEEAFIDIEKGIGMNSETKREGVRRKNFFGTYSLGPFLILNPLFTKKILRLIGLDDTLCFEKEIVEAYQYRLEELSRTI